MTASVIVDHNLIHQFVFEQLAEDVVRKRLTDRGCTEDQIADYLLVYKKALHARRRSSAFIYIVVGAVLGFFGCFLAIMDPIPELHGWFLYGLTSLAILVGFYGFYLVFE